MTREWLSSLSLHMPAGGYAGFQVIDHLQIWGELDNPDD